MAYWHARLCLFSLHSWFQSHCRWYKRLLKRPSNSTSTRSLLFTTRLARLRILKDNIRVLITDQRQHTEGQKIKLNQTPEDRAGKREARSGWDFHGKTRWGATRTRHPLTFAMARAWQCRRVDLSTTPRSRWAGVNPRLGTKQWPKQEHTWVRFPRLPQVATRIIDNQRSGELAFIYSFFFMVAA